MLILANVHCLIQYFTSAQTQLFVSLLLKWYLDMGQGGGRPGKTTVIFIKMLVCLLFPIAVANKVNFWSFLSAMPH